METCNQTNLVCNHSYKYCSDGDGYRIKACMFDSPISLGKAISEIRADDTMVDMLSAYKYFVNKTLAQIQQDLSLNNSLKDLKVLGMINFGQTAFVFETEDGDILKITSRDHFLGRKQKAFDLPIKKHIKISPRSFCHYYLEEKTSENFSDEELFDFSNEIRNRGYKIVDNRWEQFGKTKDGHMVLIDPECARRSGLFGLLKQKFVKLYSYAKIIAR